MKPHKEIISTSFQESILVRQYNHNEQNDTRFPWHFHDEIELVYIRGGHGNRFIGNHLSVFESGEFLMIGSNIPHSGLTDGETNNICQTIVHLNRAFFDSDIFKLPEFNPLQALIQRSQLGISIQAPDKDRIGSKLEDLYKYEGLKRILKTLEILQEISASKHIQDLNHQVDKVKNSESDSHRMNKIFNFVAEHYMEQIQISTVAQHVDLSDSAFCRYFKRFSGKTFTQFVNEYRIMNSCQKINQTEDLLHDIALSNGYNNFSYFNRMFTKIMKQSPSEYRKENASFIKG